MTDDLVTRARQAVSGVTDGPWVLGPDEEGEPAQCLTSDGFDLATLWGGYNRADADAAFIAAARELVPLMADRIEELEKSCAEWAEVSQRNYQRAKSAESSLKNSMMACRIMEDAIAELRGQTNDR